jgi:hypothetical protein
MSKWNGQGGVRAGEDGAQGRFGPPYRYSPSSRRIMSQYSRRSSPSNPNIGVDAVPGQIAGWLEARYLANLTKAALDTPLMRQVTALRVEQGFPGPGENVRIVPSDLQSAGAGQPRSRSRTGRETLACPQPEGVQDPFGVGGFRWEWVVEEPFQVPGQLLHEVGGRLAFDGKCVRRENSDSIRGLAVQTLQPGCWIAKSDVGHLRRL